MLNGRVAQGLGGLDMSAVILALENLAKVEVGA